VNWRTLAVLFRVHGLQPALTLLTRLHTLRMGATMSSNAANAQRWFKSWRSTPRPAPDTDPADLGTAFGLDLSMSEVSTAPPATGELPADWALRLAERRRSQT